MTTIEQAKAFAEKAHAGQTRKGAGAEPYSEHLAEVADLVASHGGSVVAVCAAWLHDTVEDCGVSRTELAGLFGEAVAGIVLELTDDKALPKAERKRIQVMNAAKKSPEAALVKICDKMSNVRAVGETPPVHWDVARQNDYLVWAEAVVAALPDGADTARGMFSQRLAAARAAVAARAAS